MPEIQKKKKKKVQFVWKSSICFVFSCKMLLFKPITLHANRNEPEKATGASQLCISTVRKFSTKIWTCSVLYYYFLINQFEKPKSLFIFPPPLSKKYCSICKIKTYRKLRRVFVIYFFMFDKTWQYTFKTGFFYWFLLEQDQQIQSKIKERILLIMKHFRNMICVNIYMVKTKTF